MGPYTRANRRANRGPSIAVLIATAPTAASCGGDDDARATTPTETSAPSDDYAFAGRVGARYGGVNLWGMDAGRPARVVVTGEPTRVNAVDLGAGHADRSM